MTDEIIGSVGNRLRLRTYWETSGRPANASQTFLQLRGGKTYDAI